MAVVDELQIIVNAKTAKAVADLKKTQKATNNTAKSAASLVKSLLPIASAAAGFAILTKFTKDSMLVASAAQETISKYNTIFREVSDESKAMADQLSSDFDLAGSTARQLLGDTGDLLTGFGLTADEALNLSDTTNRLAIDLASFSNAAGGAEGVSKALVSAFSGEREALKTYGIVISETMVKAEMLRQAQQGLTFASEQEAKIRATLTIAQNQSKNAIGDYARTSESAANVSRRLGEAIKESQEIFGTFVNEGVTPAKSALANFITEMNNAARQSKELAGALDLVYGRSDEFSMSAGDALAALNAGYEELNGRAKTLKDAIDKNKDGTEQWQAALVSRSRESLAGIEAEKKALEGRIELAHRLVRTESRNAAERKAISDAQTQAQKDEEAAALRAAGHLEALQDAYADTDEGARKALESQIAYFETFSQGPMAVAVLDMLREKLAGMTEETDILLTAEQELAVAREASAEAAAAHSAAAVIGIEDEIEATEKLKSINDILSDSIKNNVGPAYTNAFGAIGDALAQGESASKAFAKATLLGFAAILDAIAAQLVANAVLALFNPALYGAIAPALAGAAAASVSAGVVRSNANGSAFQSGTGGDFVVPEGFQGDSYPINVSSGERVRVDNEDQVYNSGSGTPIIIQIDSSPIYRGMLKASQNGVALMDTRAVVRT